MKTTLRATPLFPLFFRTIKLAFVPLVFLSVFFMTLFFGVQNLSKAMTVFMLDLSPRETVSLFLSTYFDITNTFSLTTFLLLLIISLLEAVVFILFYQYMKLRHEALHAEKASVLVSTLLTLFGTSCAACGGVFLSLLSSFGLIGSSAVLKLLDSTVLLSSVLIFLLVTVYRLLKKVANPLVC